LCTVVFDFCVNCAYLKCHPPQVLLKRMEGLWHLWSVIQTSMIAIDFFPLKFGAGVLEFRASATYIDDPDLKIPIPTIKFF
jgi:hypothetical protein